MMRKETVSLILIALSGAVWTAPLSVARDSIDSGDPPGRAARLSWIDGNVSFQPGGVEDWVLANEPPAHHRRPRVD